jgi:tetratricopeptide (TPR) repeat protein
MADTVFQQACAAHKLGNLDEAERLYRATLKVHPTHYDAAHNLGQIAISVNRVDEALPLFVAAVDASPEREIFWLSYVDALIKNNQIKEAKSALKKARKKGFDKKKLNLIWAQSRASGDHQKASATQRNELLGLYNAFRFDEARKLATSLTEKFPKDAFAWKVLAGLLKMDHRYSEAVSAGQKAIALSPQDSEAHCNLGNSLYLLGKLDLAEASYIQAVEVNSDNSEAHNNLGTVLVDLGRLSDAESSYSKAIKSKSNFNEALMNRWQLLFNQNRFEEALRDADSCNTTKSRACGLETLYKLGRIDEVYKRIETRMASDDTNIRMAAFCAFIEAQEKRETDLNFCRHPISFIHISNLASHLVDFRKFSEEIINELDNVQTVWEPQRKSTRKGLQTSVNINLFKNASKKMRQLELIIASELEVYYSKFRKEDCTFIKKWPAEKMLHGWHVILKRQGYQTTHIHPQGWLSGVIYLKVVPDLGRNEGAIEFSLNCQNYSDINSPNLVYQPKLYDIVLFPSSLNHRTIPFETDSERIIISFDLMPESSIGRQA